MNFLLNAINTQDIITALNIFWKGMLAIAIVITIIILVTFAINAIDKKAREKKAPKQAEEESANQG